MRFRMVLALSTATAVLTAQAALAQASKPVPSAEERFQANVAAVKRLRAAMKNPRSFELVDAMQTPDGTLCVVYRATNSFNAVVPGQAIVRAGKISTSAQGDEFRDQWNARCYKKRGEDMVHIRQAL